MKNKNVGFISFVIVVLLTTQSCDEYDRKLVVYNLSSAIVYYNTFTDTVIDLKHVDFLSEMPSQTLEPHQFGYTYFALKGEGFAEKINEICLDSLLRLFFFNADTVKRYGWSSIIQLRKYTRFDLSVKRLDSLNWHVTYTDSEKVVK